MSLGALIWRAINLNNFFIHIKNNYVVGDGLKNPKKKGNVIQEKPRDTILLDSAALVLEIVRMKTKHWKDAYNLLLYLYGGKYVDATARLVGLGRYG